MDDSFKLGDKEHELIYNRIERETFGDATSVGNPKVIITGGQPGSGKRRVRRKFDD